MNVGWDTNRYLIGFTVNDFHNFYSTSLYFCNKKNWGIVMANHDQRTQYSSCIDCEKLQGNEMERKGTEVIVISGPGDEASALPNTCFDNIAASLPFNE